MNIKVNAFVQQMRFENGTAFSDIKPELKITHETTIEEMILIVEELKEAIESRLLLIVDHICWTDDDERALYHFIMGNLRKKYPIFDPVTDLYPRLLKVENKIGYFITEKGLKYSAPIERIVIP